MCCLAESDSFARELVEGLVPWEVSGFFRFLPPVLFPYPYPPKGQDTAPKEGRAPQGHTSLPPVGTLPPKVSFQVLTSAGEEARNS